MADDPSLTSDTRATAAGFAVGPGAILAHRYELLDYLGRGGMGVVYKAHDRTLDETVAIKILRQQPFDDPSLTQRFLAEIKLARRVTHKNVCRIHDYAQAGPVRFISMQFVDGIELREMIRSRAGLSASEGYEIALQLVDGLEAIHHEGIVHRDLKTSNVMVDRRGTALLMDFGIAKSWQGETGMMLTASGQIIGTPAYMSPEQARGEPLDPRSDIYSVGVILFELFTAVLPINADNFAAIIYKKLHEPLTFDTPEAARLPVSLKPIVRKALAAAAADRYASTRELRAALIEARRETPAGETDATTTLGAKVQNLREATPVDAGAIPSVALVSRVRRTAFFAAAILAAVVLTVIVVRYALPFFQSTASQLGSSPLSTSIPPTASVPVAGISRDASSAVPSTATPRSNTSPSTTTSVASTAPARTDNACDKGDAAACVALAEAAEAAKEFDRAADLYRKACDGKAAAACTGFGVLFNRGLGVARDAAQAATYYERGCTLGDMAGCNNLGTLYQFGSIGFRDPVKAAGLYERACTNGQLDGCANLGLLLLDTPGAASQDKTRARELLEKACAAGIARACGRVR
jgi:serine/threonine protein kinase